MGTASAADAPAASASWHAPHTLSAAHACSGTVRHCVLTQVNPVARSAEAHRSASPCTAVRVSPVREKHAMHGRKRKESIPTSENPCSFDWETRCKPAFSLVHPPASLLQRAPAMWAGSEPRRAPPLRISSAECRCMGSMGNSTLGWHAAFTPTAFTPTPAGAHSSGNRLEAA